MDAIPCYRCIDCRDTGVIGCDESQHFCDCEAADEIQEEMEAADLVQSFVVGRKQIANNIRQMRKIMRSKPRDRSVWTIEKENEWVRRIVYNPTGYGVVKAPVKPTVENLACLAEIYTLYGRAPLPWEADPHWVNPRSTEYYSACGYEDYLFEQREEARDYARILINAVDYLIERS